MVIKKNLLHFFFLIFSLILLFILFNFELIHTTYVPHISNPYYKTYSDLKYFGDTQTIFLAAECHKKGFDVFVVNNCMKEFGLNETAHQYGKILFFEFFIY